MMVFLQIWWGWSPFFVCGYRAIDQSGRTTPSPRVRARGQRLSCTNAFIFGHEGPSSAQKWYVGLLRGVRVLMEECQVRMTAVAVHHVSENFRQPSSTSGNEHRFLGCFVSLVMVGGKIQILHIPGSLFLPVGVAPCGAPICTSRRQVMIMIVMV